MMGNYNLFDLIDVEFDPPEPKPKKVLDAIEKAEKDTNADFNSEQDDAKKKRLKDKLQFLQNVRAEIFEPDGKKLTKKFKDLAKEKTEAEIEKFKVSVELETLSGRKIVTEGKIKQLKHNGAKLSTDTMKKVYDDAGFKVQKTKKAAKPEFPSNADKIFEHLTTIRMFPEFQKTHPNVPSNEKVDDLYGLIAFLEGEPENATRYRGMTTGELKKILDAHAVDRQGSKSPERGPIVRDDILKQALITVIGQAKTNVFDSDSNRAKYEKYLLYKKPEMDLLFSKLKTAKQQLVNLEDPAIAEPLIKQIATVFGTREEAIALYNYEASVTYEEVEPTFYVKCAHCQKLCEFATEGEAKTKNACTNGGCGKALYKTCSNCSQKVLDSLDKCPNSSCGFVFASMAMFSKYITLAENALLQANFNEARQYLSQAKTANPSEKTRTAELASRIDEQERIYEVPINELRELIAKKKFMTAEKALSRTIAKFPKLNVASYETQINTALEKAQFTFNLAQKRSKSECANACIDILNNCQDFEPALEFLRTTPPEPAKNVTLSTNVADGWISLSWKGSGEKGISYCIVRKEGEGFPKNELDGTCLKDALSETVFRDEGVMPGVWHSYGVFAKRMGICSLAAGASALLLAEVKDVRYEQIQESLRITWTMPKNCVGVSVSRIDQNGELVLAENAQTSCEDKRVSYGNTYSYVLKANYAGHASSNGIRIAVRVDPILKNNSFSIEARQTKGNNYAVSWDIPNKGIDLRILVDGKVAREAKSDAKKCEIELPANGYHAIEVSAFSQGRWITSQNSVKINTYLPQKVDKSRTQVQERPTTSGNTSSYAVSISVSLQDTPPSNVKGFYYTIRTKPPGAQSPPWAEVSEAETRVPDVYYEDIGNYRANQKISCSLTVKEEDVFYLSLFTIYAVNGKEVISAPEKMRIPRPVLADVRWKVMRPLLGKAKLAIDVKANQGILCLPRLILCASDSHLLSHDQAGAQTLLERPAQEFNTPQTSYRAEYEISVPIGRGKKLFLFFEYAAPDRFLTPWMEGFAGKV